MDGWAGGGVGAGVGCGVAGGIGCEPWAAASAGVAALEAAVRWQAGRLEDIRQHALTVTVLSWESPAGRNFRNYLSERCSEIGSTIELLEAAARDLAEYGRLVRDTELLQRRAGQ